MRCKLYYLADALNHDWYAYRSDVEMEMYSDSSSLQVRDLTTRNLLCDIPVQSIKTCTECRESLFRFEISPAEEPQSLAIEVFEEASVVHDFKLKIRRLGVTFQETAAEAPTRVFPELSNIQTQEDILQLIFNDDFADFVDNMTQFLGKVNEKTK
jgi:hypothetical protein